MSGSTGSVGQLVTQLQYTVQLLAAIQQAIVSATKAIQSSSGS